jgi:hypothetical protein
LRLASQWRSHQKNHSFIALPDVTIANYFAFLCICCI